MTRDLDDVERDPERHTLYILRDDLRRVLIHDRADRDAIASQLLRHDENGQCWADIIDLLSIYPDARRRVVRALGELTAKTDP
jgi:hypothetical protein